MEVSPLRDSTYEQVLDEALTLVARAPQQARTIVEQALERIDRARAELTYARAEYIAGICHTTQGRLVVARPFFTRALATFERHGLVIDWACCLREEGVAAYYAGEYAYARGILNDAYQTLELHAQPLEASRCLIWLATLENFSQSSQAAQDYLAAARAGLKHIIAPIEQAACDFVAGLIAARRTHYEDALECFATAETQCLVAEAVVWLGRVYIEQGYTWFALDRLPQAASAARQARAIFREHGMPQREAFANELLAQIATTSNHFGEAQQLYEDAQTAYEAASMPVHSTQALIHRANIDYFLGAWELAEVRYREALERGQRYGARIPIFIARSNLGLIAWKIGRYDEGLTFTQLALTDALSLERHDDAARCHLQLAGIYVIVKQHDQAVQHYQAALTILADLDTPLSYAHAQREFAEFCLQIQEYAQARALAESARTQYVEAQTPLLIGHSDLLLARIALAQAQLSEASALLQSCIDLYSTYHLSVAIAQAQLLQGAVAVASGAEALAQDLYQQAIQTLHEILPTEAADGAMRLAELAERRADDVLALKWRCQALRWIQQARSRVPTEHLAGGLTERYAALLQTTLTHAIRHREYGLALMLAEDARSQVALSWIEGHRRSEPLDPTTLAIAERCVKLRQEIETVRDETSPSITTAERLALLTKLEHSYDEALALWRRFGSEVIPGMPHPFDWQAWLNHFKDRSYRWQVLAYWYMNDQLVTWHCTPDTIQCVQRELKPYDKWVLDLCSSPEYSRRLYLYHRPPEDILTSTSGLGQLAHVAKLVLPDNLADSLTPDTLLIIVPAGPLHTLPFAALPLDGKFLVSHATPLIAPSLHLLERLDTRSPSRATRTLAIGVTEHRQREALPYACLEAKMIKSLCAPTDVWCDAQATVGRIRSFNAEGSLRQYRQIHFATHAWPDLTSGMQAGMSLFDGDLAIADLAHLDLDADLVVLSACDSGIGKLYAGEEVVSLTFALLQAGTRALVTSLWPVIDKTTLEVMTLFYKARQANIAGPWGLAHAQRRALEDGLTPYTWAGFIWSGAPNG